MFADLEEGFNASARGAPSGVEVDDERKGCGLRFFFQLLYFFCCLSGYNPLLRETQKGEETKRERRISSVGFVVL